jgi:hypothetical protein
MNRHAGELRKHSIDFDFIARKLFTTRIISGVQERKEQGCIINMRQCCNEDIYLHMIVSLSSDTLSCTYKTFMLCDPATSSDEPSVLSDI